MADQRRRVEQIYRWVRDFVGAPVLWWWLAGLGATLPAPVGAQELPRIVAIGDVHGAYESFVAVLVAAGLVDSQLEWTGAATRLVVLGDLIDRGPGSRRALELMMKLHDAAVRTGGEAELLLGNHEVMNLMGDLRYVSVEDYAAYRAEELPTERAAAWQRFRDAAGSGRTEAQRAAEFAQRYPPGFFGQRAAFSSHGRFGSWLLQRPVLTTIGRTAFVHGGLSAAVSGQTAEQINREYAAVLREYVEAVETLAAAGVLNTEDSSGVHAAVAKRIVATADASTGEPVRRAAERLATLTSAAPFRGDSVFWYRGTVACSAAGESARLAGELAVLGVERLVVGHTPTVGAQVVSRFDGAVIRADTSMVGAPLAGRPAAVVIRGAAVEALYLNPEEQRSPRAEPRRVGPRIRDLGDDELEDLLLHAPVTARTPRNDGTELLQLERAGVRVAAIFRPATSRRGTAPLPEVAAYQLDRLLELDLVPVAVRRVLDARVGSLQLDVAELADDARRISEGANAESWCPLRDQLNLMYAFDWLAGNPGRTRDDIRYVPEGWRLVLTGNGRLFSPGTEVPAYLLRTPIEIPGLLAAHLARLDAESLAKGLGETLDERQRRAILTRRDQLLARATARQSQGLLPNPRVR